MRLEQARYLLKYSGIVNVGGFRCGEERRERMFLEPRPWKARDGSGRGAMYSIAIVGVSG